MHFFRIVGIYEGNSPQYIIRDPELIKKLGIKDFEYFEDHRSVTTAAVDPSFVNSLIALNGKKWHDMRGTLSPAFTGSKMRQMFELISEYADDMVKFHLEKSQQTILNCEMKEFFTRCLSDIIATCAFGLKVNSFADPTNEFYVNGKEMFNLASIWTVLKIILNLLMPRVAQFFKIGIISQKYSQHFKSIILDTIQYRKEQNIYRPDMIDILMQIKSGSSHNQINKKSSHESFETLNESEIGKYSSNRAWTDDELVAQCSLFFAAGSDTSSSTLTLALYELVANPDIQQKLYVEIIETNKKLGDRRISYDVLQRMRYLDQVISETLRKWPPQVQTDRLCVKDYYFDDGNKLKFKIEKGRLILFQIYGIHHDEKYFTEPEKFNPDRFSDENKNNIISGTYMPFGIGPRNCIGEKLFCEQKRI